MGGYLDEKDIKRKETTKKYREKNRDKIKKSRIGKYKDTLAKYRVDILL